jgi:tetratricopeptide (TPR) repeat protein
MRRSSQPNAGQANIAGAFAQAFELHRLGRLAEAERLYEAVLAVEPGHCDALHSLGLIRFATGRPAEALRLIARAMQAGPPSPTILLNHGIVLSALDRPSEAIASFDRAIALEARFFEAHNARGVVLTALGRSDEAIESFRSALAIAPHQAETHYNLGNAFKAMRRFEEALASYDGAIALHADYAEAFCNRGVVLHEMGMPEQALASFDRALALQPGLAEAHSNRGNALKDLKRFEEALSSYDAALALRPAYPEALSNRGVVLNEMKRRIEALESLDRALALRPDYAEALSNRGAVLHAMKRYDEALVSLDRALALRPDHAEAHCNRGAVLCELMRVEEALGCYDRALAARPDMPEAHWNEASLRLLLGDFARGWAEYEWRWKREALAKTVRAFPRPRWSGKDEIEGKTILLHSEQGYGDSIQFCRYAPLVAARGARVLLEVERPLRALMTTLAGVSQVLVKGEPLPQFDLHCPLLSLPLAFGTELSTIPARTPYLHAAQERRDYWRARLGPTRRPRIGLAWSGNPSHHRDTDRSIALRALLPVLRSGATFVSLQKNVRPDDAAELAARRDILDFAGSLDDFSDTAALIAELDLVISVDTSIAHLAGALGKPTWVLLPYLPDWRWLLGRDDSPWYPSLRLFRQDANRRWESVVARVREALGEFSG